MQTGAAAVQIIYQKTNKENVENFWEGRLQGPTLEYWDLIIGYGDDKVVPLITSADIVKESGPKSQII